MKASRLNSSNMITLLGRSRWRGRDDDRRGGFNRDRRNNGYDGGGRGGGYRGGNNGRNGPGRSNGGCFGGEIKSLLNVHKSERNCKLFFKVIEQTQLPNRQLNALINT